MSKITQIISSVFNYVRNSWEGEDGKFSYKRASQFIFVWLMVFMIIHGGINSQWSFYTFLVLAVLFTLTAAIITVPQLIVMIKSYVQAKGLGLTTQSQPQQTDNTVNQTSVEELPKD
jgi:hypothetical protein